MNPIRVILYLLLELLIIEGRKLLRSILLLNFYFVVFNSLRGIMIFKNFI
jgi:hypothetical protein